LQQAEKAGLIIKAESKKRGRIMSEKGKEFLDSIR
jgi:ribosomal protein S19E (S16A)